MADPEATGTPAPPPADEAEEALPGAAHPSSVALSERERAVAKTLLRETREELVRADGKAALLLAGLGVAIGTILAVLFTGDRVLAVFDQPWQTIWYIGGAACGIGIAVLSWAVYPRRERTHPTGPPTYYGHLLEIPTEAELAQRLKGTDPDHRMLTHLLVASRIVHRKYQLIRWSLYLIAISVVLTMAAVVGGKVGEAPEPGHGPAPGHGEPAPAPGEEEHAPTPGEEEPAPSEEEEHSSLSRPAWLSGLSGL